MKLINDYVVYLQNTLEKLSKIDVTVFARLCDYFNCKLTDIVEYIPNNN